MPAWFQVTSLCPHSHRNVIQFKARGRVEDIDGRGEGACCCDTDSPLHWMKTAVVLKRAFLTEGVWEGIAGVEGTAIERCFSKIDIRSQAVEENGNFEVHLLAMGIADDNAPEEPALDDLLDMHVVVVKGPGANGILPGIEDIAPLLAWANGVAAVGPIVLLHAKGP